MALLHLDPAHRHLFEPTIDLLEPDAVALPEPGQTFDPPDDLADATLFDLEAVQSQPTQAEVDRREIKEAARRLSRSESETGPSSPKKGKGRAVSTSLSLTRTLSFDSADHGPNVLMCQAAPVEGPASLPLALDWHQLQEVSSIILDDDVTRSSLTPFRYCSARGASIRDRSHQAATPSPIHQVDARPWTARRGMGRRGRQLSPSSSGASGVDFPSSVLRDGPDPGKGPPPRPNPPCQCVCLLPACASSAN